MGIDKELKHYPQFIVVDGGDGCGKDTQAKFIARYYQKMGIKIRIRSHPSVDNTFGRQAKCGLEQGGKKGYLVAALFYAIDVIRSLVKFYRPNRDEVMIFSRYLLGVCYLPAHLIFFGYNFFSRFLPTSQYFFYLDVTPEIARERIQVRGETYEMFESLKRLRKMQRKMRIVTKRNQWYRINGDPSPSVVWSQIRQVLIQLDSENEPK
ncbi:MAG: thymidylate kinase [Candidatus Heimdallarchaeota archaeon]|nr:MAG: thymidylate kinase [Candidatus Heimdallarchaeota archaeon]